MWTRKDTLFQLIALAGGSFMIGWLIFAVYLELWWIVTIPYSILVGYGAADNLAYNIPQNRGLVIFCIIVCFVFSLLGWYVS